MGTDDEIDALRKDLATLQARLDELEPADDEPGRGAVSRRGLIMGLAGASAAAVAGVATADPAAAAGEPPVLLGATNNAAATTAIHHTSSDDHSFGVELTSNAWATLAVAAPDNPDVDHIRYAIWADMRSEGFGDASVYATAKNGFAVITENDSDVFPAVAGSNHGEGPGLGGGSFTGGPQLYLEPGDNHPTGPPSGTHPQAVGLMRLDSAGDLWVCVASGSPGTWTRLLREDTTTGRVVPITPTRVLDSRATGGRPAGAPAVPGQKKGPLKGGEAVTLDIAGAGPIPATATGVIGNLTVTAPSYGGYLIARPSGTTSTSSALNWASGATVGNNFTCKLGPAGLTLLANGTSTQHYELIIDLTAYIT